MLGNAENLAPLAQIRMGKVAKQQRRCGNETNRGEIGGGHRFIGVVLSVVGDVSIDSEASVVGNVPVDSEAPATYPSTARRLYWVEFPDSIPSRHDIYRLRAGQGMKGTREELASSDSDDRAASLARGLPAAGAGAARAWRTCDRGRRATSATQRES
uniref:Uncharacterized protein n=1 Tax=Oryza rufipogon TaxID=4529 RepID=A0A0E0RCP6_ORYRU